MAKGIKSTAKNKSANSGSKQKVKKVRGPPEVADADDILEGKGFDDYSTHEAVVPPRQRPKTSATYSIHEENVQRKPPVRATKSRAKEAQIWMDPDVGARKGRGATDAHKVLKRERALSSAAKASKAKRFKAALEGGTGIPKPSSFDEDDSDSDVVMDDMKNLKASQARQKQASRKNPTKAMKHGVEGYNNEADSSSNDLDEIPSDVSDDEDGNIEESSGDSDVAPITESQFSYEQATIIKSKIAGLRKTRKLVENPSDNDDGNDEISESSRDETDSESLPEPPKRKAAAAVSARSLITLPPQSHKANTAHARQMSSPVHKTHHQPAAKKKVQPRVNKRAEAYKKEQPMIKAKALVGESESEDQPQAWSVAATAVANARGKYNFSTQPGTLQKVIEQATFILLDFIAFKTVYPDYSKPGVFMNHFFLRSCKDVGKHRGASKQVQKEAKELHERFDRDARFVRSLAGLAMTRFFQFRARSKTIANLIVPMSYGSETGTASFWDAELKNDRYVYGRSADGDLDISAPYQHRAIKNHLQMWLMEEKGNGALALKHKNHFKKLAVDDHGIQLSDGELSIPLVAASAAAIQVVIDEKRSGLISSPPFNEELLGRHYMHHVEVLTDMQLKYPNDFREFMSALYSYVRSQGRANTTSDIQPMYEFNIKARTTGDKDTEGSGTTGTVDESKQGAEAEDEGSSGEHED
ncbi:hypothetical protein PQX77_010634 [Marasmius sp. AFHP31]|nr:hypothetical protein PQX77_010634 [Marasmius sp. AFHP31]